jgi:mannan endo-1,4-beta-mannosidase
MTTSTAVRRGAAGAGLLVLVLVAVLAVPRPRPAAAASGFVTACGIHFCLDGHPFYFAGANTYDVFTYGDGSSTATPNDIETRFMDKARIDAHFAQVQADHVMVNRVWMFDHEESSEYTAAGLGTARARPGAEYGAAWVDGARPRPASTLPGGSN